MEHGQENARQSPSLSVHGTINDEYEDSSSNSCSNTIGTSGFYQAYQDLISGSYSCTCYKATQEYSRSGSCSSFDGGTVSEWQETEITANFKTQVATRITIAAG